MDLRHKIVHVDLLRKYWLTKSDTLPRRLSDKINNVEPSTALAIQSRVELGIQNYGGSSHQGVNGLETPESVVYTPELGAVAAGR